jgi:hypothetical protein
MYEKRFWWFRSSKYEGFESMLLRNWIKRYIKDEGKIWRKVIDSKYCMSDNILHSNGRQASPFWKGVMLAAQAVKHGYKWVVGDGKNTFLGRHMVWHCPSCWAILEHI